MSREEVTLPAFYLDANGLHPYPVEPGDLIYYGNKPHVIICIVDKWRAAVRPCEWWERPFQRLWNRIRGLV